MTSCMTASNGQFLYMKGRRGTRESEKRGMHTAPHLRYSQPARGVYNDLSRHHPAPLARHPHHQQHVSPLRRLAVLVLEICHCDLEPRRRGVKDHSTVLRIGELIAADAALGRGQSGDEPHYREGALHALEKALDAIAGVAAKVRKVAVRRK